MTRVFTIGYGKVMFPELKDLLDEYGIQRLVDVRSSVTRFRVKPGFYTDDLLEGLGEGRFRHEPRLGGKYTRTDAWFPPGKGLPRHPEWEAALGELLEEADQRAVCVMCAEDDPRECHRGQWIQKELEARGVEVVHIRRKEDRHRQLTLDFGGSPPRVRFLSWLLWLLKKRGGAVRCP